MSKHADGHFVIESWDQTEVDAHSGATTSTAVVRKTFTGDISGSSLAHLVLAVTTTEGSMAYVGLESLTVSVQGREGSFLLLHRATSSAGQALASWQIVDDSGTGALAGISGTAQIDSSTAVHGFTLDYDLPGA
jgi:hypothetical protein